MVGLSLRYQIGLTLMTLNVVGTACLAMVAYGASRNLLERDAFRSVSLVAEGRERALLDMLERRQEGFVAFLTSVEMLCGEQTLEGSLAWERECVRVALTGLYRAEGALATDLRYRGRQLAASGTWPDPPKLPPIGQLVRITVGDGRSEYTMQAVRHGLVLQARFSLDDINIVFQDVPGVLAHGEVLLTDRDGYVLTTSRHAIPTRRRVAMAALSQCLTGSSDEMLTSDDRKVMISGVRSVAAIGGGCIVATITQDDALAPVHRLGRLFLYASAGLILVGGVLSMVIAGIATRPINRLVASARRIAAGQFDDPVPVRGASEVRLLSCVLATMGRTIGAHISELSAMHLATVEALAHAIDAKDPAVKSHVQRVQLYAVALAKVVQAPESVIEGVRVAALLHDVGKIAVPDHILTKTEPLTDDEVHTLRRHPELGARIVGAVAFPYPVASLIRSHHERWNGSGYPDGLRGAAIPLGARIIAVASRFESLRTGVRINRVALGEGDAIRVLLAEAGTAFDPRLVDAFVAMLPVVEREIEMTAHTRGSRPETAGDGELVATNVFEDITRATLEQALLFERARADSLRDPLTDLPNRRFLTEHMARELSRTERTHTELALVMIDLNNFKVINDRYGHQAGDDALRGVAQCLRGGLRPYDVCCRYGGDEFVMVLSGGCTAEMVNRRSEKIRQAVEGMELGAGGDRVLLTFSIGIAMYPRDGGTYDELLHAADADMYAHKGASKVS